MPPARAEVGARRRPQPHAGPQIAAQQQAAQDHHTLLQETVAAGGSGRLLDWIQGRGRAARAVGHSQQGGNSQHQPVAAYARGFLAARLVPFPAYRFETPEALFNPVAASI